jgi:hypothetical protein
MTVTLKGQSPFYPGQPVPVELFVGRAAQIQRVLERGAAQVAAGKPMAFYIQGEYGIGKSSIARCLQGIAERQHGLHAIYATLGAAETLEEVGAAVLEATLQSGAFNPNRSEKLRTLLAKYIGEQSLFGLTLRMDVLKQDAPQVARGMLPFLQQAFDRLKDTGVSGLFLVLDEINGITKNPKFAHLIKGLVDANALSPNPLPLLLLLCGVEERRWEMIQAHQPTGRIFDVVEIPPMSHGEMGDFFTKAFGRAQMKVEPGALGVLMHYSAGYPKIMHLVGDAAYWSDKDAVVDKEDAIAAVLSAADEVGKKYVDRQVYKALKSADYRSILAKIGTMESIQTVFRKQEVASGLTENEKKKFNNFLQKMKRLNVLRAGDSPGEYVFTSRMVRLYIWLQSPERKGAGRG